MGRLKIKGRFYTIGEGKVETFYGFHSEFPNERTRTIKVVSSRFDSSPARNPPIAYITVLTSRIRKPGERKSLFRVSFSFCSPSDVRKFCRQTGRVLATRASLDKFYSFKKRGKISEIIKALAIKEAKRRNIQWMKYIQPKNLV